MARILGDGTRRRTAGRSHIFSRTTCSATASAGPRKGNDKGKVEALVEDGPAPVHGSDPEGA